MNHTRSNLLTKSDIDIQKENKFKQIVEQSNVDLSINSCQYKIGFLNRFFLFR